MGHSGEEQAFEYLTFDLVKRNTEIEGLNRLGRN